MSAINPVEFLYFLGKFYEGAYYYYDKLRQTVQAATIGKRDMVCLKNGCWLESSYSIPDSWVEWQYSSENHTLLHTNGPRETEHLGWLAVSSDTNDLSPFFSSLRCGKSEDTKYIPTDSMLLSLFALQNGWMPKGMIRIILGDASVKTVDCGSLFSLVSPVSASVEEESEPEPEPEEYAEYMNEVD